MKGFVRNFPIEMVLNKIINAGHNDVFTHINQGSRQ